MNTQSSALALVAIVLGVGVAVTLRFTFGVDLIMCYFSGIISGAVLWLVMRDSA